MALVHISQNWYKYRIDSYRIAKVYLYFVMNIVDMSYGTRRTVLTKKLVTQLADICGDMWRVITRANSSHIVGKIMTVGTTNPSLLMFCSVNERSNVKNNFLFRKNLVVGAHDVHVHFVQ